MATLSIADLIFGVLGVIVGIYTTVVHSNKCAPKDKTFFRIAGIICIVLGIAIIAYPFVFVITWLLR